MATETIPVIDIGPFLAGEPGALDRTAKELHFALTEIGFYFIVNHGVPREKIQRTFAEVKRFHEQPLEKKLALKLDKHSTGYMGCPGVAEAAVIGVPHPKWDERPLLIVQLKQGQQASREDILKYMDGKIAKWWMPDDVQFIDAIPHGATGKILKTALRDQFKDYRFPNAAA